MGYEDRVDFSTLVGQTLRSAVVSPDKDQVVFTTTDGQEYVMYHSQDCCESVSVEDIVGDLADLLGSPIVQAEESTSGDNPKDQEYPDESFTWTFYRVATVKGTVVIRWYGSSNGYYSESVDFEKR